MWKLGEKHNEKTFVRTEKIPAVFFAVLSSLIKVCDLWGQTNLKTPHYPSNHSCNMFMWDIWMLLHLIANAIWNTNRPLGLKMLKQIWCNDIRLNVSVCLFLCAEYLQCFLGNLVICSWIVNALNERKRVWSSRLFKYTRLEGLWVCVNRLSLNQTSAQSQ